MIRFCRVNTPLIGRCSKVVYKIYTKRNANLKNIREEWGDYERHEPQPEYEISSKSMLGNKSLHTNRIFRHICLSENLNYT